MAAYTPTDIANAFSIIKQYVIDGANNKDVPLAQQSAAAVAGLQIVETVVQDLHRIAEALTSTAGR